MQAKQMAESLQQLAPILEQLGNAEQGRVLRKLAEALTKAGSKAVSTVIRQVESRLTVDGAVGVSPAASLVWRTSLAVEAAGAKTPAKDFAGVAGLLQKLDATSAEEVYERVSAAMAPPPRQSKAAVKQTAHVRALADELTANLHENEKFDELIERLAKLQKNTLASIAAIFLGYERAYKTKTEILKAIRARQVQEAIEASRERRISRIAV